jgi:hypothetical protein
MRWLAADDDSVTYVRETNDGWVVVSLARRTVASRIDLCSAGLGGDVAVALGAAEVVDGSASLPGTAPVTVLTGSHSHSH